MIIIVGGRGAICDLQEVKCGAYPGDIIVDLEGSSPIEGKFILTVKPWVKVVREAVGRIMVGGVALRSIVGLGELEGDGVVRGVSGENYGVIIDGRVVVYGRPLITYLIHEPQLVVEELLAMANLTRPTVGINDVIESIVRAILSERRSRRVSMILSQLEDIAYGRGDPGKLPAHILDSLINVGALEGGEVDRVLMRRIIEEVKARVYG